MKEIFAGVILVAGLAAVVTSGSSDGQGTGMQTPDRKSAWSELHKRGGAQQVNAAHFVGARDMPVQVKSPSVLLDPAKRFADAVAVFAADIGAEAGPELGATWLVTRVAWLVDPGGLEGAAPLPADLTAVLRWPLPLSRPPGPETDGETYKTQGVLAAALHMLEKAGLEALSSAVATPTVIAGAAVLAQDMPPDPGIALYASHRDRAPGRQI